MSCPNCNEPMREQIYDNQTVLHCGNCGGSFFEENGINRISEKTAKLIASEKKDSIVHARQKFCPRDKTTLSAIDDAESVPPGVVLLSCTTCRGIFAYPNDLLAFKKGQSVKIEYFKLWNIPLPSMKSVMVFASLFIVAVSVFATFSLYTGNQARQTQASDLMTSLDITRSGHYVLISFATTLPFKSEILFRNKTKNQSVKKSISDTPIGFHHLTTGDVDLEGELFYTIILTDGKGKVIVTEEKKLVL